jgi:hypothetical protein
MRICGKKFKKFNLIVFKIIVFEGRRECSFVPFPARLVDFDSRWRKKLELYKVEVFEIIMCGM